MARTERGVSGDIRHDDYKALKILSEKILPLYTNSCWQLRQCQFYKGEGY